MVESLQVSERGSRLEKRHDIAIQALRKAITEFNLLDLEESTEEIVNSTFEGMPNASNKQTINLCGPPLAASKGHPHTLHMKDSLELLKKGSSSCGYCKEKGHNKLKCPSLKHRRICYLKHNNDFQQDHKIHNAGDVTSPQLATWLYSRL